MLSSVNKIVIHWLTCFPVFRMQLSTTVYKYKFSYLCSRSMKYDFQHTEGDQRERAPRNMCSLGPQNSLIRPWVLHATPMFWSLGQKSRSLWPLKKYSDKLSFIQNCSRSRAWHPLCGALVLLYISMLLAIFPYSFFRCVSFDYVTYVFYKSSGNTFCYINKYVVCAVVQIIHSAASKHLFLLVFQTIGFVISEHLFIHCLCWINIFFICCIFQVIGCATSTQLSTRSATLCAMRISGRHSGKSSGASAKQGLTADIKVPKA